MSNQRAMQDGYEWTPRPPNAAERIAAGVWTALILFAVANMFAGWHVFGRYDAAVTGLLTIVGLLGLRLLPKVRRI